MANAVVTVATGRCKQLLTLSGPLMERYAERIGATFHAITKASGLWWGIDKFRAGEVCKQYDRTIFVDADVMVHPRADNLLEFVPESLVGMHNDYPFLEQRGKTAWIEPARELTLSSQGIDATYQQSVFNTGIIVASNHHADIWRPLQEPFVKHHCAEQFWIEHQAYQHGIHPLEPTHNWQWWFRGFNRFTPQFKHYANCPHRSRIAFMRRDLELHLAH